MLSSYFISSSRHAKLRKFLYINGLVCLFFWICLFVATFVFIIIWFSTIHSNNKFKWRRHVSLENVSLGLYLFFSVSILNSSVLHNFHDLLNEFERFRALSMIVRSCLFCCLFISFLFSSYLPTPPLGQDMTQGQFLSGV